MPSMTRRGALGTLAGLVGSVAGCTALRDDDSPPFERSWYVGFRKPSSVATTSSGQLLAGSHSPFRDQPVVAELDVETGETTWSVTMPKGGRSPIGVRDDRAYAVSKAEQMVAVDTATGAAVWRRQLEPLDAADPGVVEFAPLSLGDRVIVPLSGTEDDVPDRVVGVARADGETLFTHGLSASLSGAPGAMADSIVLPLVDGRVRCLDRDGSIRWTQRIDGALSAVGTGDGLVYLGAATEEVIALNAATGAIEWRQSLANTVFARPLVTDDRVYVGGANYSLRAFDTSGQQLWRDDLDNAVTHGPMQVGDRLVTLVGVAHRIRGHSGTIPFSPPVLYVHDRDGTRRRTVRLDDQRFEGGGVEWAQVAGDTVYLGQSFGLTRVAPEVITDA